MLTCCWSVLQQIIFFYTLRPHAVTRCYTLSVTRCLFFSIEDLSDPASQVMVLGRLSDGDLALLLVALEEEAEEEEEEGEEDSEEEEGSEEEEEEDSEESSDDEEGSVYCPSGAEAEGSDESSDSSCEEGTEAEASSVAASALPRHRGREEQIAAGEGTEPMEVDERKAAAEVVAARKAARKAGHASECKQLTAEEALVMAAEEGLELMIATSQKPSKSGYAGVVRYARTEKWAARVKLSAGPGFTHLGYFEAKEHAALVCAQATRDAGLPNRYAETAAAKEKRLSVGKEAPRALTEEVARARGKSVQDLHRRYYQMPPANVARALGGERFVHRGWVGFALRSNSKEPFFFVEGTDAVAANVLAACAMSSRRVADPLTDLLAGGALACAGGASVADQLGFGGVVLSTSQIGLWRKVARIVVEPGLSDKVERGSAEHEVAADDWLDNHKADTPEAAQDLLSNLYHLESTNAAGDMGEKVLEAVIDAVHAQCPQRFIEEVGMEGKGEGRGAPSEDPQRPNATGAFDLALRMRRANAPPLLEATVVRRRGTSGGAATGGAGGSSDGGSGAGSCAVVAIESSSSEERRRDSAGSRRSNGARCQRLSAHQPCQPVPPMQLHPVSHVTATRLRRRGTSQELAELRVEAKATSIRSKPMGRSRNKKPRLSTAADVKAEAHGLLVGTVHVMGATPQIIVLGHSGTAVEETLRGTRRYVRTMDWSGVPAELATAEYDFVHELLSKHSGTNAAVLAVINIDDWPALAPQPSGGEPSASSPSAAASPATDESDEIPATPERSSPEDDDSMERTPPSTCRTPGGHSEEL